MTLVVKLLDEKGNEQMSVAPVFPERQVDIIGHMIEQLATGESAKIVIEVFNKETE